MNKNLALLSVTFGLWSLTGCDDGGKALNPDGARPDGGMQQDGAGDTTAGGAGTPAARGTWPGVYDSDGTWDLSGPFGGQRTLGNVVADLLVDEIVSRSGVPSVVEDKAKEAVSSLIGGKVKALVDAQAPAALKPNSDLLKKLGAVFASTEVASAIDLPVPASAGTIKGTEEIRSFTFTHQGQKSTLPVGTLLERTVPLVTLGAEWKGKEGANGVLAIEPHDVALRLGRMVLWVVDNVLKEQGATSLSDAAAAVVDCNAIVAALLDGKGSFSFGVGVASYSVGATALQAGCGAVVGLVKTKALGMFDVDAGVALGGDVLSLDDDGDTVTDRLKSGTGFGGVVTKMPAPVAVRVTARFQALRRKGPRAPGGFGPHYADMSNTIGTTARLPIRGRIIQVAAGFDPGATTAFNQVSQDEMKGEPVVVTTGGAVPVTLGMMITDDEGYIDQVLDISTMNLPAGNTTLRFLVRDHVAGTASARLLAAGGAAVVVRSDVDLTYLDTDFMSTTGKLQLLVDRASERKALPAMEVVYRALRRGPIATDDLPLTFLSGSPTFFKMVLEEKMRLDGIAQDGVVLKPFKDIVATKVTDLDLGGIIPALEEQVGYKLSALLRLRLEVPQDTREILMGDDSEADAVAYALYHQLTSRQLGAEALMAKLDEVNVDASWKAQVAALVPQVIAQLPAEPPVIAIYINLTGKPNAKFPVASWTIPALTRAHQGAWPLALDLYEESLASGVAVEAVRARLKELGRSDAELGAAAQAAVAAGYLRAETVSAFP